MLINWLSHAFGKVAGRARGRWGGKGSRSEWEILMKLRDGLIDLRGGMLQGRDAVKTDASGLVSEEPLKDNESHRQETWPSRHMKPICAVWQETKHRGDVWLCNEATQNWYLHKFTNWAGNQKYKTRYSFNTKKIYFFKIDIFFTYLLKLLLCRDSMVWDRQSVDIF